MSTTLHNLEAVEANAERQRLCLRMFEHYKIIIPALAALGMDGAGASGLVARKSRWRKYSPDNRGGFMLIDPQHGGSVAGHQFDMDAEEVVEYCKD